MTERIIFDDISFTILSVVNKNPNINKTGIVESLKGIGSKPKVTDVVSEMIESNYLIETKKGLYNIKTYQLTEQGRRILNAMENLRRIMNGEEPEPEPDFVTPSGDIQSSEG